MKAIVMKGFGDVDVLFEEDIEIPMVGDDEVLLKVEGCGVCYRDTIVRRGFMRARTPIVPGHEVSGTIVELGGSVRGFSRGDLVASLIYVFNRDDPECTPGRENTCRGNRWIGEDIDGCYAEYVKLPYWVLVRIGDPGEAAPEAYSFSACVIGMLIRAYKSLGQARKGEYVLVTGASGGVGLHAVQVGKALGLKVIAVTRSEDKAKLIESMGADNVIVYKDRFSEEVRRVTDGRGPDIVIETVGGPTIEQSIRAISRGGRLMLIGNVDPRPQQLPLGLIILKEVKVLGVLNSTLEELREAVELIRSGRVKPFYRTIRLDVEEVREAHRILESGRSIGRIVIRP